MAGLSKKIPPPTRIVVHQQSRVLEIEFADDRVFELPFELLRVYSPSAEVRGHGPGQETLQTGKRLVGMSALEPTGNYAVQPHFDDGHNTGIYSWDYLYWLGDEQTQLWQDYIDRLAAAGESRDAPGQAAVESGAAGPKPAADSGGTAEMSTKDVSRPR